MEDKLKPTVYGVGYVDINYVVKRYEYLEERYPSGKKKQKLVWICPYYMRWKDMLERCYSKKLHEKHTTYKDCTVCEEWLYLSKFKEWMITQDWEGNQLDKDFLIEGSKHYSPDTCVFIKQKVNTFINDSGAARGNCLIGCSWLPSLSKYVSNCNNPFTNCNKDRYIGLFTSEIEAHLAWKKRKHEYAIELSNSDLVSDLRIIEVLLTKFKNYNVVEDHIK